MGRIKKSIVPKPDRAVDAKRVQPSMRRMKRALQQGKYIFRKNNRFLKKTMTPQLIEDRVLFTPKRKKKHTQSAPLSSVRGRKLIEKANRGEGKVEIKPRKTIWHETGIKV